jgi:hypothetical protein
MCVALALLLLMLAWAILPVWISSSMNDNSGVNRPAAIVMMESSAPLLGFGRGDDGGDVAMKMRSHLRALAPRP